MKACIDTNEWYPVYTLLFPGDEDYRADWYQYEVTPEERADYERVLSEFRAWQQRIEQMQPIQ